MNELLTGIEDKFDMHHDRLRNLEEKNGIKPPSAGKGSLDKLQNRMEGIAREDLGVPPKAAPKAVAKAAAGGDSGGTGGASTNKEHEELMATVMDEVRGLHNEADEIKDRLHHLDAALDAMRAGSPAAVVREVLASP